MTRSVLLPGESIENYLVEKQKAVQKGMKPEEFDRQRLLQNGWTDEKEAAFRNATRINTP